MKIRESFFSVTMLAMFLVPTGMMGQRNNTYTAIIGKEESIIRTMKTGV